MSSVEKIVLGQIRVKTRKGELFLFVHEGDGMPIRLLENDIFIVINDIPWKTYPTWCCVLSKLGIRYVQGEYLEHFTKVL